MKDYPEYPVFEGEKYVGLNYKYLLIDQDYKLYVINDILCNVEYQADGSSNNIWKQYFDNPKGFAFLRIVYIQYNPSLIRNIMDCIHYVSSSLLSGNKHYIAESPIKIMTTLCIPFGFILSKFIIYKNKKR
ncbi:MAG: hypothetical protein LUH02_04950 [Erysipelotrichaceae bacterium]|nr:hypothetical protein [Erysipelotrichaceae bacterium]